MVSETLGWIVPRAAGGPAEGRIAPAGPSPSEAPERFGLKSARLGAAAALGLPVPPAFVIDCATMADPAAAEGALARGLARLEEIAGVQLGDPNAPLLLALRPSAPPGATGPAGGGGGALVPSILNIGVTAETLPALEARLGARAAADLARRFIQSWGAGVAGLDGEEFEYAMHDAVRRAGVESEEALDAAALARVAADCRAMLEEEDALPPEDARAQLAKALAAMGKAWAGPGGQARRAARGGDAEAGLAIMVQVMALGLGGSAAALSGAGLAGFRSETTGAVRLAGRFLAEAQGEEALMGLRTPLLLTVSERLAEGQRDPALEERAPSVTEALTAAGLLLEDRLAEDFALDFTLETGRLWITELRPAKHSARAAVRLAVDLADRGAITRDAALQRIDPGALEAHLHPTIDESAPRDLIGQGLPASPGAASGPLVFTPEAAEAAAAGGKAAILALVETSPEDIRGMHAAHGVLTVRGGMTSHAAVVARGLGKPCVVGAKTLRLSKREPALLTAEGRRFAEGDVITVDGASGQVIAGAVETRAPELTGAFARLMTWADETRRLGVRANADTGADARVAAGFEAAGIGLCRTEHMFFQGGRITPMRRMILAGSAEDRRAALAELHPMQRSDFTGLFRAMPGLPVVIRLLDPPLHEFLPHGAAEIAELGRTLGLPEDEVLLRARELAEFNPMLGKRGCRVGIAYPEIYEMQVRAVLEAAIDAGEEGGQPVVPEIMIPLVSAVRELALLRERIDAVASAVRAERETMVDYRVGVMLETPRACLRAGEIARLADFISFGTNDLTQMTYGLSRDDAGRFMPDYVSQEIYEHDPFHSLDHEGVGELMQIATERARAVKPDISVGLCGEQGADARSVAFCERAGFDYVSCSPQHARERRFAPCPQRLQR
ncbi:MAG: pyruvate, phosphate dikinase, partial [Pseudomonadota bacterium]